MKKASNALFGVAILLRVLYVIILFGAASVSYDNSYYSSRSSIPECTEYRIYAILIIIFTILAIIIRCVNQENSPILAGVITMIFIGGIGIPSGILLIVDNSQANQRAAAIRIKQINNARNYNSSSNIYPSGTYSSNASSSSNKSLSSSLVVPKKMDKFIGARMYYEERLRDGFISREEYEIKDAQIVSDVKKYESELKTLKDNLDAKLRVGIITLDTHEIISDLLKTERKRVDDFLYPREKIDYLNEIKKEEPIEKPVVETSSLFAKPILAEEKPAIVEEVKTPIIEEVKTPIAEEVKEPIVEEVKEPIVEEKVQEENVTSNEAVAPNSNNEALTIDDEIKNIEEKLSVSSFDKKISFDAAKQYYRVGIYDKDTYYKEIKKILED